MPLAAGYVCFDSFLDHRVQVVVVAVIMCTAIVCTTITMWCPDPTLTFTTRACCSSLWLNLGAPVGLGNECTIDMEDMEDGCPMYDCYRNKTVGDNSIVICIKILNFHRMEN